ncbi:hypothetical protein PoHVEF18_010493 [Penicillium ochrochloron]
MHFHLTSSTRTTAQQKMLAQLDRYHSLSADDDTVHFLKSVFRFLPLEGRVQLADDVDSCDDDDQLRQLARHLDTALLRPMVALFPRPGMEDFIEDSVIRRACLQRDNNQCVVTKFWDPDFDSRPPNAITADLEALSIIPFGMGMDFQEDERIPHAQVWSCLHRYFPDIRGLLPHSTEAADPYNNMMMLANTFPNFGNTFLRSHIPEFVILSSRNHQYPVLNRFLLAAHAAVGNILHTTGHGKLIEKTLEHLRGSGGYALAEDGRTDVEELLSVTRLALLAAKPQPPPACKEKHPHHAGSTDTYG